MWIFAQMSTCFACTLSSHFDSGAFGVAICMDVNAFWLLFELMLEIWSPGVPPSAWMSTSFRCSWSSRSRSGAFGVVICVDVDEFSLQLELTLEIWSFWCRHLCRRRRIFFAVGAHARDLELLVSSSV